MFVRTCHRSRARGVPAQQRSFPSAAPQNTGEAAAAAGDTYFQMNMNMIIIFHLLLGTSKDYMQRTELYAKEF